MRLSALLILLVLFYCGASDASPNIIVLLADDLGYGELGCQGNPQIPTPHIDRIAAEGVRFTQGYVTAPNCSPSRAGLLTGKIPTRFGYEFNPIGARNEDRGTGLPSNEMTLAERLQLQGYTTGLIGKWHLGGAADFHPFRHGFDEFFGFMHEGHYFVPPPWTGTTTMLRRRVLPGRAKGRWLGENLIYSDHMGHDEPDYDANNPIIRAGQPVVEPAYLTDAFTREGTSFIRRHADKPFFLLMAYNAVHSPLQGADRYMERFADIPDVHRRIFAAMLGNLDDSVGAILKQLDELQLANNTLIIFLSDNGGPTRELTSSNLPLRGGKGEMYEGGLRVPFMMRWPDKLPRGLLYEQSVSSLDILPTALAAVESSMTEDDIDGVDLLPYLTGEKVGHPHLELYWRQGKRTAYRNREWKLVRSQTSAWELYHVAKDPMESKNLAEEEPGRLADLIEGWKAFDHQMVKPLFGQR